MSPLASRASLVSLLGFTAGFMILPSEWHCLGVFAVFGLASLFHGFHLPKDRAWLFLVGFLVWMVGRSFFGTYPASDGEMERGILGAALLCLLALVVWRCADERKTWMCVAISMGWVGAVTAAISALMSYVILPPGTVGERLTNLFVHGGLNAVCTGVSYGFAAVWLVVHRGDFKTGKWVWLACWMLQYAVLLTRSRGALLALALSLGVWLLFKKDWRPIVLLVVASIAWAVPQWLPISRPANSIRPATEMAQRADAGRFRLYRAAWSVRGNPLIGTGQWGITEEWMKKLPPDPNRLTTHFHSGYLATFIHGGLIGCSLLFTVMALALARAWKLAKSGDAGCLALLAYGWTTVLFDGQSLASLTTMPRYEGLVFWLPILLSLARKTTQRLTTAPA